MREYCGLFIFINHSQLFLIHQTAKEFLLRNPTDFDVGVDVWKASLSTAQVELEMALICVTYLYLGLNSQQPLDYAPDQKRAEHDFFDYCVEHWTSYLQNHDIGERKGLLERVLELYDTSLELFQAWFPVR